MRDTTDDLRLVKKVLRGESEYFSELVAKYESRVYKTCMRFVRNQEDALDLSQEIFIKIYNNLASFREHSSLSTWIYKISVNICLNFLRTKNRLVTENITENMSIDSYCEEKSPEKHVMSKELYELLNKNLEKSGQKTRKIFFYRLFYGLPFSEIARRLGVSQESARMNYFRTKKQLRNEFQEYKEGD